MKINFILPGISLKNNISGGAKVIYQYSNYLSENNNDVYIYYDLLDGKNNIGIPNNIMRIIKKNYLKFNKKYPNWFNINKKVKQIVCNINNETIRNADLVIASAYTTTDKVNKLVESKGKKVYFIQDFEHWNGVKDNEIYDSYKLNYEKITVAKWLKEIIDIYSKTPCTVIINGVDEKIFKINIPIEHREKQTIAYLYSDDPRKGCKYGLEIIKHLIRDYPNLKINMFGYPNKPEGLPSNINYTKNATEEQVSNILNNSTIYMCTSLEEGFGLPGLEAMSCGCALVSTTTRGVYEYANENVALLSKEKDVESMKKNICFLFDNDIKRIELAKKGNVFTKDNKLSNSCEKFETTLRNILHNKNMEE